MGGDAVELALALYRMPVQRFALRGRPLPSDIGVVIKLASGSPSMLQESATRHCVAEDTIREASRFYLQQVLFASDADAYRVLGLSANASADQIREHYRWLQRWLHPDRRDNNWDSVLTTRVNWAWQRLRNDASRRAYDAERLRSPSPKSAGRDAAVPVMPGEWQAVPLRHRRGTWLKRIALGLSFGSCLGLLYLALTRLDPMQPDGASIGRSVPAVAKPLAAIEAAGAGPRSSLAEAIVGTAIGASETAEPIRSGFPNHSNDAADGAQSAADVADTDARPYERTVAVRGDGVAFMLNPFVTAHPKAEALADLRPSIYRAKVGSVVTRTSEYPAGSVSAPAGKPVSQLRSVATPLDKVSRTSGSDVAESIAAPSPATERDSGAPPSGVAPIAPPPTQSNSRPTGADLGSQQLSSEALAAGAPHVSASSADAVARVELARQRIADLAEYFGGFRKASPPVWNDAAGQVVGERQRSALRNRTQLHAAGEFEVTDAAWRISEGTAALRAKYNLRNGGIISESGQFALNMIWREQMWLVTRVELIPAL